MDPVAAPGAAETPVEQVADAPAPVPALAAVAAATAATTATSGTGTPGLGTTGTLTPMINPEQIEHSLKVSLADLSAKATALYAHKNYEEAAEVFAQAAEMQAEINGEMSPANAEILFLYGRALYKVGQSKSDVFGGNAPDSKQKKRDGASKAKRAASAADAAKPEEQTDAERITEEGIAIVAAEASGSKKDDAAAAKKPLFQFEGDENWDGSDDEAEAGEGEADDDDDDDDLAVAYEVLDLARVLYNKRLEEIESESAETKDKDKEETGNSAALRHIKERLADTHDLLAEISLEGERFHDAIPDSRKSLAYKLELYPEESEIVAEAHFKLSLALEFASIVATDTEKEKGVESVDQKLRDEAAKELEAAISSTKMKLQSKEVELATNHSPEDNDLTRKQIADVKEVIADMEQRLVELRGNPMDVEAMLGEGTALGGILGAALGESQSEVAARVEEAKKTANDLTSLIRKKPAAPAATEEPAPAATNGGVETNGNGNKRKLDETEPEPQSADDGKKAKVEKLAEAAAAEA